MKLLDLFCGQGGAAMGYYRAGFSDITGIDNLPQPRYPFKFIRADALEYLAEHGHEYDVIHASPPCQAYSRMKALTTREYPMLVPEVRRLLLVSGKPFVIENVVGAPLINPLLLCGTMFGLLTIRHRLFETCPEIYIAPASCNHYRKTQTQGSMPDPKKHFITVTGRYSGAEFARLAMGINWMNRTGMTQAIPPAYTEYVGRKLLEAIDAAQTT